MQSYKRNNYLKYGALAYILINILQGYFMPLINDEAYYWAWSQKLDWGYFDHPPMVALWAKAGFAIFQNELGVRLATIFFGGMGYYILGRSLQISNNEEFWLYTVLFYSMVLFQAFGFITTPDSPLLFFGILYLICLRYFLLKPNTPNALFLGLVMALLLYSKYHGILLIIFSLLPLTLKLIKNKYFYLAVGFGILCYLPHLYWQFTHDFVSAEYHLIRRNVFNHFKLSNTTDYLLSLVWASSPLLIWFTGKALIKTKYKTDYQKALFGAFAGIVGFFILITFKRYIQGQWSLLAFIPWLIISYEYFKNRPKDIRWIVRLGGITFILMLIARIYFVLPDVPFKTQYHGWKSGMKEAGKVTEGIAVFEKYQFTSLFTFNNYPEHEAKNYITIENRHSQYELWDSEVDLEGKDITYFSKYIDSDDSIVIDSRDKEVFYYKRIKDFHTSYFIEIKTLDYTFEDNILSGTIEVTNTGNFTVDLTPDNNFELKQVYITYPYSEQIKCERAVNFDPLILEPNSSKVINFKTEICPVEPDDYILYLGFSYQELPPKKQSDYIELKID